MAAIGTEETPDYDIDWIDSIDGVWGDALAMRSLSRFGGPATTAPWRFDSAGWLQSGIAQAPDGTIYAIERIKTNYTQTVGPYTFSSPEYHASILVIDGQTGKVQQRLPLPDSPLTFRSTPGCESGTPSAQALQTQVSSPVIGADGAAFVAVRWLHVDVMTTCNPGNPQNSEMYRTLDNNIHIVKLTPASAPVWSTVSTATFNYAGGNDLCTLPVLGYLDNHVPIPDSRSGVMVRWINEECDYNLTWRITRVDAQGATTEHVLPESESIELAGDDGAAYLKSVSGVRAIDVTTWATKWTSSSSQTPIMPLADGGAVLRDPIGGAMTLVDAQGNSQSLSSLGIGAPFSALRFGRWEGITAAGVSLVVGPEAHDAMFSFQRDGGHARSNYAARKPYTTVRQAAIEGLQYYNPDSIRSNREFSVSICRTAASVHRLTQPNISVKADSVPPPPCPSGTRMGRFHTHGRDGNNGPSSVDIGNANADVVDGVYLSHYVGTPCGGIFRYWGPAGMMERLAETTEPRTNPPCVPW